MLFKALRIRITLGFVKEFLKLFLAHRIDYILNFDKVMYVLKPLHNNIIVNLWLKEVTFAFLFFIIFELIIESLLIGHRSNLCIMCILALLIIRVGRLFYSYLYKNILSKKPNNFV